MNPKFPSKKVVYIFPHHCSDFTFEQYGVNTFRARGFELEIFEISPFYFGENKQPVPNYPPFVKVFENRSAAIQALEALDSQTLVIPFLWYCPESLWIFRTLSKHKVPFLIPSFNPVGTTQGKQNGKSARNWKTLLTKLSPKMLKERIFHRIPFSMLGVQAAKYFVVAGGCRAYRTDRHPIDPTTKTLWGNASDYEKVLKAHISTPSQEAHIVFVDDYIPFHADYRAVLSEEPTVPEKYFPQLNAFFDKVSEHLKMPVIVASHPAADEEMHKKWFPKRECVKGKTLDLIYNAKLVLGHGSTSLSYANCFRKPVIFLTSDDLKRTVVVDSYIQNLAEWFGKEALNLDHTENLNWQKEMKIDEAAYKLYGEEFIKAPGDVRKGVWELVCDELTPLELQRTLHE